MENSDLILEVSNIMTYESCDEKGPPPAERRTERNVMIEKGREAKSHCGSHSGICMEAPLSGGRYMDSLFG